MITEAIILASGKSKRLATVTKGIPKCFIKIMNKPLYQYPLDALIKNNIKKIIMIVPQGYKEEIVEQLMRKPIEFRIIENPWIEKGNAFSTILGLERAETKKPIITCCDTIAPPSMYRKLIEKTIRDECDICIASSRNTDYIDYEEATKILTVKDRVINIGKNIVNAKYIDTGIMTINKDILEITKELPKNEEIHLYQLVYKALEKDYSVKIVDTGTIPWTEIDTPKDLTELLKGKRTIILQEYWREMIG